MEESPEPDRKTPPPPHMPRFNTEGMCATKPETKEQKSKEPKRQEPVPPPPVKPVNK